jgi:hypothetical protein
LRWTSLRSTGGLHCSQEYSNELADRERQERLAASQRLRGLNKALSSVVTIFCVVVAGGMVHDLA